MNEALLQLWTNQLVQLTLAILVIGLATRLICRTRPQLAYALWVVVLIKCLLPPVWASRTGAFSWMRAGQTDSIAHAQPTASASGPPVSTELLAKPITFMPHAHVRQEPRSLERIRTSNSATNWIAIFAGLYLCGTVVLLLTCLAGAFCIRRRLIRSRVVTSPYVQATFDAVAHSISIPTHGPVPLIITREAIGPALVGLFKPFIVIPEALARSGTDLRPVFAHELLHFRRRDHWVAAIQLLAVAMWWFHPLVWWMNRQISRAREMSCDEQAIASLRCRPHDYGQMLVDVMRLARRPRAMQSVLGVQSIQVTQRRLEHVVNNTNRFRSRLPWTCYGLIVAFALLLLPGARVMRAQEPQPAASEGRKFSGIVIDKETKAPIAGAVITLGRELASQPEKWEDISKEELITDANGKFEFAVSADELANKRFCLSTEVRHPRYAALNWEGEGLSLTLSKMEKGEAPWFSKFEMMPGEEVSGIVEDPQGKALANCNVRFRSTAGEIQTAGLKFGSDLAMGTVKTDADGKFRFVVLKGSKLNQVFVEPDEYAVLGQEIGAKRGDLGTLRVLPGQRIAGTVIDSNGTPISGVQVEARSDKRILIEHAAARHTTTDASGRFSLAPVPPDKYLVFVKDDRFIGTNVMVTADAAPEPIEFRPPPLNVVRVSFVDSSGKPSAKRNRVSVSAFKSDVWFHTDFKGEGATAELRVPKGMENTQLNILGFQDMTMVWRIGEIGDWRRGDAVLLGTLRDPVTEVTVMQYKSPRLTIRAVGPDGQPVAKFRPQILYTDEGLRMPAGRGWSHDIRGDVGFEPSLDGTAWSTVNMLIPDREINVWVFADRMQSESNQQLVLKEGEEREITVKLKAAEKE